MNITKYTKNKECLFQNSQNTIFRVRQDHLSIHLNLLAAYYPGSFVTSSIRNSAPKLQVIKRKFIETRYFISLKKVQYPLLHLRNVPLNYLNII